MGIALKGDFIGFWINNIHSSELGIIRTSDGSRFNENLLPNIQDKTVQVPGGDGFYYFGSYYTQRQFNIPIAFDNLEESQFKRLRQLIGSKTFFKLTFDETPYKYYNVKSAGSPMLKYICFDDESGQLNKRIYKGEGTLSFVAYYPFGIPHALSLDKLVLPNGDNVEGSEEWTFNMKDDTGEYQYPLPDFEKDFNWTNDTDSYKAMAVNNSGDVPCDYQLHCFFDREEKNIEITDYQFYDDDSKKVFSTKIYLDKIKLEEDHIGICIDSSTSCVYGIKGESENMYEIDYDIVYNQYLTLSNFSKFPVGNQMLEIVGLQKPPKVKLKLRYF